MKKGISLIVLVITIIVMIIIAGAIILSLSNSHVTQRANEATLSSDRGNYQALYATKLAEKTTAENPSPTVYAGEIGFKTGNTYGDWTLGSDGNVYFVIKSTDTDQSKFKKAYGDIISSYTWLVTALPSGVTAVADSE